MRTRENLGEGPLTAHCFSASSFPRPGLPPLGASRGQQETRLRILNGEGPRQLWRTMNIFMCNLFVIFMCNLLVYPKLHMVWLSTCYVDVELDT